MNKLGAKKTIVIATLLVIACILVGAEKFIFAPKAEETLNKLNAANSEIATLQTELDKMRADYEIFQKQKLFYESISKMGFFNDQDRVIARERFDTMQRLSKIISARYEIRAANVISDPSAAQTGFVVMESPIAVTLSAIDDLDIYRFIYYLNYGFPGHVAITSLSMERKTDITPSVLKQIGTGSPPEIISATLELDWRTMARKESISPSTTTDSFEEGIE